MIKHYLKRALSMLLAIVLVLTTFFVFDPDLLRIESDAYVDVESATGGSFLSEQTFNATETIYLKTGTSAFEHYENFDYNTGAVTSPVDATGHVYFKNDDATEVKLYVNNTYRRSDKSQALAGHLKINGTTVSEYAGMTNGSSTRTKGTLVTSASSGTLNYTIASGSLSGCEEGSVYIIEWVVEYKINGKLHYAFAYTGVYAAPDDQAGITMAGRHQNDDATTHTYNFITGGHKVSGGNAYSAITDTSGNTKLNPLHGFVGQQNDATNYTITGGNGLFKLGSSYFPSKENGGVAAQSFDETSCGGSSDGWGTIEVSSNHYTEAVKDALNVGTYDNPDANDADNNNGGAAQPTILRSFSDNYSTTESMCTGVAYLLVDTSRYSNYAQIPNFRVGWLQLYSYRTTRENFLDKIEITDSTGKTVNSAGYTINVDKGDMDESGPLSYTRGLYSISGPVSAGLKFAFFTHVVTRDRTVSDHRMFVYSNVGFHTTTWNQATLRKQYNDALCSVADYQNIADYASSLASNYTSYYGLLKEVGEELADPTAHSKQADANLVANLQNFEKTISEGAAPEVYFYVPEVIYINPIATSNGKYPLQYYVDRVQADKGALTTDGEKTSGNIYFHSANAVKVINLEYKWLSNYGGAQMNLTLGATSSPSGTLSTTVTGTIDSYANSYLEWTLTYVNKAGQTLKVTNYSCCYASKLDGSNQDGIKHNGVISATSSARRKSGELSLTTTGWIVGANTVDSRAYVIQSTTAGTATDNEDNGVNWDHYGAYVSNYLKDRATGGPTAGSQGDNSFGALYDSSKTGGSGYWASNGSVDYSTGGKGTIIVDSSRYTNLNQIPNLYAGVDANNTDRENSPNEHAMTMYLYSRWYNGTDIELAKKTDLAENWGGNLPADREVRKINAAFNAGFVGTQTAIVSAKGYFKRSGDERTGYSSCYLVCTFKDKSPLREAFENTVKKSQYLQKEFFTDAEWSSYNAKIIDVASRLLYPEDGNTDYQTKANDLTNQVNKMVAAVTATSETYSYTKVDKSTATANRADVLKKGTATIYHVLVDINDNGEITGATDLVSTPETKTYYFGETVLSGFNNYEGCNYFGYYRSEGTTKWTQDLGKSVIQGDMAAQGGYGLTGHRLDQYVYVPKLTYTYIYSKDPSGVYMDWGESDLSFEKKDNLANLTNVNINTAYEGDDTYYPNINTETVYDGVSTYESPVAMVSKTSTDSFSFSIKNTGYNIYTTKPNSLKNLFNFDSWGWDSETVDKNLDKLTLTSTAAGERTTAFGGASRGIKGSGKGYRVMFDYKSLTGNSGDQVNVMWFTYASTDSSFSNWGGAEDNIRAGRTRMSIAPNSSGTYSIDITPPEGFPNLSLRFELHSTTGTSKVEYTNIRVYDLGDSSNFAKMNDLFFPSVATGLTPGKTYTVAFESSLRYDDYRWFARDMYGDNNFEMDWAHEQGTIQMFMTTSSGGDDLYNYTVPVRITTDISTGGTIGTFTMPSGCSVINLGFCVTNDTPLAGWVDNIRITEGDYLEVSTEGKTYTLQDSATGTHPSWPGYTFAGWSEESNPFHGALSGDLNATYTFGETSDTVLANWTVNKYDVTFDNEFVFDEGWTSPNSARGELTEVNTENNYFTLKTLTNAESADNTVLSNDVFDLVPGHRYKVSLDYMPVTYASGSRLQIHVFHYTSDPTGSWETFPGNTGYAPVSGSVYHSINQAGGTASIEFVVPEGYKYGRLRLGNADKKGIETTFSNIYIQDITRGVTGNLVHDTTASEPHVTLEGQMQVVHGLVRNYKKPIKNEDITELPVISSELYDFAGWNTKKDGTGSVVTVNDLTEATTNQKWSQWTVHLDYQIDGNCKFKDGYTAPSGTNNIAIGGSVKIADHVPYKIGYNFKSWKDIHTGKEYQPGDTVTLYCNANLTPVWEDAVVASKDTDYTQFTQLYPGQIYFYAYKVPANNNEYVSGYVYDTNPDVTMALYSSSAKIKDGSTTNTYGMSGVDSLVSNALTKGTTYYYGITADVEAKTAYTSKFRIKEHYINYTLDLVGGTGVSTSATGHYNTATALGTPVKTGYTFLGWRFDALSKTYTGGSIPADDNTTVINLHSAANFVINQQLVAQWSINKYNHNVYAYMNVASSPTSASSTYSVDTNETAGYVTVDAVKSTNGVATKAITYGDAVKYTAVEKTGYTFKGWYLNPTMSGDQITGWPSVADSTSKEYTVNAMNTANKNVYARFDINTYVVNIAAYSNSAADVNNFIASTDGGTVKLDTGSTSQTYVYGQKFTMTAEAKTGYDFSGWYFNQNNFITDAMSFSTAEAEVTVSPNLADSTTGSINYKAKFAVHEYQLNINTAGGSDMESYKGYMGGSVTLDTPTNPGYTFDGWYLTTEFDTTPANGVINNDTNVYTFGAGNDIATAKWKVNSYAVTIDPNGGEGSVRYETAQVEKNETISASKTIYADYASTVTLNRPTKTGYSFDKWEVTANKEVTFHQGSEGNASTYIVGLDDGAVIRATWNVLQFPLNVQAWGDALSNEETYTTGIGGTVKIGADGEFGTNITKNIDYNTTATITAKANTGYTFLGWTMVQPTNLAVFNTNKISDSADLETQPIGAGQLQYYAVFGINKYNVSLDIEYPDTIVPDIVGGTVTGEGTYTYGTQVTVKATANTGYAFAGWYNGDTLESNVANYTFSIANDVNLTAKFDVVKYTITTLIYSNTADNEDEFSENAEAGSVAGETKYYYNKVTSITATANAGYVFDGWYRGNDLITNNATLTETVTGHATYNARFRVVMVDIDLYAMSNSNNLNSYENNAVGGTVSFNGLFDGANDGATANGQSAYGGQVTVYAKAATGYNFDGWYPDETLQSQSLGTGNRKQDGSYAFTTNVDNPSGESLWAKFSIASFTLDVYARYNSGNNLIGYNGGNIGGTVAISRSDEDFASEIKDTGNKGAELSVQVYYGKYAIITATPAKGYAFDGWYTDANLENRFTSSAETETAAMTENGLKYYAKFSVVKFTLVYDPNGGLPGSVSTEDLYYNTTHFVNHSAKPQERVGFIFQGWSLSPDAETPTFDDGAEIPYGTINDWYDTYGGGTVTLYAVWAKNANTIIAYSAQSSSSGTYYMDYAGEIGGKVVVYSDNPDDINDQGQVVVPVGAAIEDYLRFEAAPGYMFKFWNYTTEDDDIPADGSEISPNWGADGLGTVTMPTQPVYIVAYFEIQTFAATAKAYYNTAAQPGTYAHGATGGTVKLGRNGSNSSEVNSEDAIYGSEVLFVASPARGYNFSGWYNTPVFNGSVVNEWGTPVTTSLDNRTTMKDNKKEGQENANDYYAVFSIKSFSAKVSVKTYAVREDEIHTLTEYTGGNPSNVGGNAGVSKTINVVADGNWTASEALTAQVDNVYYGQRVYFEAIPETGYAFGGWYNKADAEYYGANLVEEELLTYSSIMRESEMYIEAKFVPMSFTLILSENGGVAGNPAAVIITYNSSYKIAESSTPTYVGKKFLGWSDSSNGTAVEAYSKSFGPEIINVWFNEVYNETTGETADKIIYAVWEEAKVVIELDKQGATSGGGNISISVGDVLPQVEVPVYEGYVFGGYYTDIGGEGEQRYTADGKSTYLWTNTTGGTLYAKWTCPVLESIDYNGSEWVYTYQDVGLGTESVTTDSPATTLSGVTDLVKGNENLLWWTVNVNEVDTGFVEEQIKRTPGINLNDYSETALVNLRSTVIDTNSDKKLEALSQPMANSYVAEFAKNLDLDYSPNVKTETIDPVITLHESKDKIIDLKLNSITPETSANGSTYAVPGSTDSSNYTYADKWSYTANGGKGAEVDYYVYTNSLNPVVALEVGDGQVGTTVSSNNSSYPTKVDVVDNATNFSYVESKYMTGAVPATENLDDAWFTQFTTAGIGTAYDYNAKTVLYLTPEFDKSAASGTKNEIVYTISVSDDAIVPNEEIKSAEISGKTNDLAARYQSYQYDGVAGKDEITVCICYHNSMNGDSDEGTIDASGTYMQMYMDQVQDDVMLNQLHLLRISGGASNSEFPTVDEKVYPIYDKTYSDLTGYTLGSFAYVFDSTNSPEAAALAEAGKMEAAKQAIINDVAGNADKFVAALRDRSHEFNINGNSDGLGVFAFSGWSNNFYPKTGSFVYAHLVDRWGNVFNRVWKCYNVDSYPSTINGITGTSVYNVFEDGGSNIDTIVLDGANVEFVLDDNSMYEDGVFTTTGNTVTLNTGVANKTYNLTITDKATNKNTVEVTTDGDGVLVLNVEDAYADLSSGAYSFTLNGETVNLYSGVTKLVYSADITGASMLGDETVVTVKTSAEVIKLQLVEGLATRTYTPATAVVTPNEDGTLTWVMKHTASKGTHTYDLKARTVSGWEGTEYTLTTEIIEEYVVAPNVLKDVYDAEVNVGETPVIKVKTLEGTQKIQLKYSDGSTRTFSRNDDIVTKSVDGVEIWELTGKAYADAGENEVTVVAKYNNQWQINNEKTSTVTVIEKAVSTESAEILSVEADAETAKVGEYVTYTVVTNSITTKIRFNFVSSTSTYSKANATVTENADGTLTWVVNVKFFAAGETDVNFSAKSSASWADGKSFGTIEVTK